MTQPSEAGLPRGAVMGGVILVVGTILLAAVARPSPAISERPVAARNLFFADRSDGAVVVIDADHRDTVSVVSPGTGGFVRGTLRGLARQRKRSHLDLTDPFALRLEPNGRLVLRDPATGQEIELSAFGPTNAAVFREFLGRSQ